MLTFPVAYWGGGASRTYITSPTPTFGSATSATFTSVSLGTAIGTSLVVVVVHLWDVSGDGRHLSSATINGVAATIQVQTTGTVATNQDATVAIISAVTAGTSGNIVLTATNTVQGFGCDVYRLNNLTSTTPTTTASNRLTANGTSVSVNITAASNGILIHGCSVNGLGSETISGTGTTVDHTQNLSGDADFAEWAGSLQNTSSGTVTLSNTFSSGVAGVAGAAWN